jgi:hypothetical protein
LNDAVYDVTSANTSITVSVAATGLVTLTAVDASTTQKGVVELATDAEVITGTDTTRAVTPDGVRQAAVYKTDFNAKGDLLTATANDTPAILPVGTASQYLKVDLGQATGLIWDSVTADDVVVSPAINGNTNLDTILRDAVYDINSANSSITITETATGINDIIVAQATETLIAGAEIATQVETETGTDDTRMVTPLKLRTAAIYKSDFDAKGDILSASADNTPEILGVGTNGQVLVADSTTTTGLAWSTYGFALLDDISAQFDDANDTFTLKMNGVAFAPNPNTNIMVFLGGVPQVPGVGKAYTVTGSLIAFAEPPLVGTSFYATTVMTLP